MRRGTVINSLERRHLEKLAMVAALLLGSVVHANQSVGFHNQASTFTSAPVAPGDYRNVDSSLGLRQSVYKTLAAQVAEKKQNSGKPLYEILNDDVFSTTNLASLMRERGLDYNDVLKIVKQWNDEHPDDPAGVVRPKYDQIKKAYDRQEIAVDPRVRSAIVNY